MPDMSFLRRWLGGGPGPEGDGGAALGVQEGFLVASEASFDAHADRQRVTVWLRLKGADFEDAREQRRIFGLEDALMRALDESGAGEHDTNSLESGYLAIRLVGDDADAVVAVIVPLLAEAEHGSYLAVRRGPAGSGEDRIPVGRDTEV
jgi:hypothetical protein